MRVRLEADELQYMKPEERMKDLLSGFRKRTYKLKAHIHENAVILPVKKDLSTKWGIGGVVSQAGDFIDESIHPGYFSENENRFGGLYSFSNEIYNDDTVIYMDPIILQWGHFLVDSISRLWYALDSNKKIAFCGYGFPQNTLNGSYLRFFELLGIYKERLIDIRKPTRFKQVIIPEMS